MASTYHNDTIVALSTPSGSGALGVIRVSGPQAFEIVQKRFKGKDITRQASHTLHFGLIMDGESVLDEVVVGLFRAPKSYTREDVVEISCHGSSYIIQRIIALLIESGARAAKPGEFTLQAFLNGAFDLARAEAVADLIASNSRASHDIAMQQMRGGFAGELNGLREQLIHFASMIELELDFSEEDVEFADRQQLKELILHIHAVIDKLVASFELGNVLKNGVPVVIAGKPNVGKSTLLNALLNEERAIVSDIAGTTRDTIEDEINIEGIIFRFIDTAGIRETADLIEAKGVERTLEKMKQAKLIVYMVDAQEDLSEIDSQIRGLQNQDIPYVLLINKSDLLDSQRKAELSEKHEDIHFISAREKSGVEELKKTLLALVDAGALNSNEIILTNLRHLQALKQTRTSLNNVLTNMDQSVSSDFLAVDIRRAIHSIGEIVGEVTTDDLLDNIFSKFCIGK